ncbi:MAG: hypothetical protein IKO65_05400 [Victivallales bacterium]|nr:hypothetical protein [Victivallales bacterium]
MTRKYLFALFFLIWCGATIAIPAQDMEETAETTDSVVEQAATDSMDAIQKAADQAETTIQKAADQAEATIQKAADQAGTTIQKAATTANTSIQQAADQASATIYEAAENFLAQRQAAEAAEAALRATAADVEQKITELNAIKHNRKCIAMLRFPCLAATYTVGTETMQSATVADDLLSDFNQYFLQSPYFRVLSRQDDAAIDKEKLRILNAAAASGDDAELAKLTRELGLDYFLAGTVKQLYIAPPQTTVIQLTGAQYVSIPSAAIELDYRIVDVATTEIVWADHIIIDLAPQEIAQAHGSVFTLYHILTQMASRRIAEAMDAIAPIRILQISPTGEFTLDRAGTLIIPGALFDVFRRGEPILDPETGEELGSPEYRLATVQVKRVDAKFSYAEICTGSGVITPSDLEYGLIARPYRLPVTVTAPVATPPAPATAPIILLPQDR